MTLAPPGRSARRPDVAHVVRLAGVVVLAAVVAVVAGLSGAISPLAPLGAVLAATLLVVVWQRPLVASVLVASVVPATAGLARGLPVPGLKASEALLAICLVPLLLRRAPRWRRLNAVDVSLAVVAVVGLGLAVLNGVRAAGLDVDTLVRTGLFPAFTLATWWVVSRGVSDRAETDTVLRWVLLVSLVPAGLGILQYLDVAGVRAAIITMVGEGLMPQPGAENSRITGPFTIAHSFGGYLVVPLIIAATLLLTGRTRVLRRGLLVLVVLVDVAALVLTVTVTTLGWAAAAFLVAAAVTRRFRRAVVALVVAAVVSLAAFWPAIVARYEQQVTPAAGTAEGAVPQTFQYRLLVWQRDYLPLLFEAAPAGVVLEPGDVVFASTESQYITLVLRGGIGLLLVTAASFVALARRASRAARSEPGSVGAASAALFGILVVLPVACVVWPYVTNAGMPQSLFGAAGAVLALAGGPGGRRLAGDVDDGDVDVDGGDVDGREPVRAGRVAVRHG